MVQGVLESIKKNISTFWNFFFLNEEDGNRNE